MTPNLPRLLSYTIWLFLALIVIPLFLLTLLQNNTTLIEWSIAPLSNSIHLNIPIILDPNGIALTTTVLFISANIFHFSSSYIQHDPFLIRFSLTLALFVISINLLIIFPHLIFLLIGWDGLGITSFILVIYYQTPNSLAAGILTALSNRIGDALIILAIAWLSCQAQWAIANLWNSPQTPNIITTITLASITNSAQIPFSSWLPAAIAAPTPVSALVHSSTLVTAGVFLLIRFFPSISENSTFAFLLLSCSSMTLIIASLSAISEFDINNIIALSTLSQLSLIIMALGINLPNLALFHLINHALFNSLLFLTAGEIISNSLHIQDLRNLGNISSHLPLTSSNIVLAILALSGTPFLTAFYSNDLILETTLLSSLNSFSFFALLFSILSTSIYSFRLITITTSTPNISSPSHFFKDNSLNSIISSTYLTLISLMGGASLWWASLSSSPEPVISSNINLIPIPLIVLGLITSACPLINNLSNNSNPLLSLIIFFSSNIWFLTASSTQILINYPLTQSLNTINIVDQGWNETFSGLGLNTITLNSAINTQNWQNNLITTHLTLITLFSLPLLIFF